MDAAILNKLDQYGYLRAANEAHPNDTLQNKHRYALKSYQRRYQHELDAIMPRYYDRASVANGKEGPASYDLLMAPRCGCDDFRYSYSAGKSDASFPISCRERITTSYRMSLSGFDDAELERLWIEADKRWTEAIDVAFELRQADYPATNIHASKKNLGGSTLAWQYLSQGGCGDRLEGAFDSRPWTEPLFVATCAHEHGHALGLNHVPGEANLMNPYITQRAQRDRGKPSDADIAAALRLGYRRRTTPPDKPDPPTGPADSVIYLSGNLAAGMYELRKVATGDDDNKDF